MLEKFDVNQILRHLSIIFVTQLVKAVMKWKTISILLVIVTALLTDSPALWGILFLSWAISDLLTGTSYIIEPVSKKENPILFGCIVGTWGFSALYCFSSYLV